MGSEGVEERCVGQAIEHRKLPDRKCRGCSRGRRQHRWTARVRGSRALRCQRTHDVRHLVSGPACSLPGRAGALWERRNPYRGRSQRSTYGAPKEGIQVRLTKVRTGLRASQAGYGGRRGRPSLPEVGAVCLNGHARICAGGAGQPASLPRLLVACSGQTKRRGD